MPSTAVLPSPKQMLDTPYSTPMMGYGGFNTGNVGGATISIGNPSTGTAPSNYYGGVTGYGAAGAPSGGRGIYGDVPAQIALPPSLWEQAMKANPAFQDQLGQENALISSQLAGEVSPSTRTNLMNQAAARGVSIGAPNSAISNMIGLNLLGTTSEALQQAGSQNYMNLLGMTGKMQLDPTLMAEIADRNARMAAAPDPTLAGQHAEQLALQLAQLGNRGNYGGGYTPYNYRNPYSPSTGTGGGFGGTTGGSAFTGGYGQYPDYTWDNFVSDWNWENSADGNYAPADYYGFENVDQSVPVGGNAAYNPDQYYNDEFGDIMPL